MPICASLKVQNRSRTRHWNRWSLCKFCGSPNRMWLRRSPSSPSLPQKSTRSIPSSAQIAMVSASSDAPFTREEWLAILPVAAADPPDVFAAGDEEEGAKEPAPPAVPLDEAAAATARFSPLLALMARALEWLRKPVRNSLLGDISFAVHRLGALVLLAALPAYASPWITLPSGPFAAGMIAHALSSLPTLFFLLYQSLRVRPRWADQDTVPHWARQISRWASLLPTVAGVCSAPSSLVEHSARDDQLCSCPGTSCAGKLPGQAAASYLFLNILKVTIVLFLCPATLWTPLVTLGPVVWATWWGALVGALLCALVLVSVPVIVFRNASISNERMTQLSLRIQRRAATIVIGQLIRTARDDPESLAGLGSENGASSAYVAFHRRLAGLWSQGPLAYLHSFARNLAFVTLPCLVLGLILNSVGHFAIAVFLRSFDS
ncbi:hypothetical protein DFJ74DRAFT_685793 [Hyaloraphidium curvatum]|nr:hypothetical protein DFJ74DRAFT_685793 [Hyaloraphidium curvatum]